MKVVIYGSELKHKPDEYCKRERKPFYFFSVFKTDYMIEVDGTLMRGKAGDVYVALPDTVIYHGSVPGSDEGFVNDWIYVEGDEIGELLRRYPLPVATPFSVDNCFAISSAIDRIHRELSFGEVGCEEKCSLILAEAIIDLYRSYTKGAVLSPSVRLEYARGEMMKDYSRSWTLAELARLAGYSESRFSSLYKQRYGISPVNDLINRRITQAKLLLMYGNMSLAEISEAVGFTSIYYFSKCFKKKEGVAPTEFKRKVI